MRCWKEKRQSRDNTNEIAPMWRTPTLDNLKRWSARSRSLYQLVIGRSKEYAHMLGLGSEDVETLERYMGRLGIYPTAEDYANSNAPRFTVREGEQVTIYAHQTACHNYGGDWQMLVMAVSSNPEHNQEDGYGTMLIVAVDDDTHNLLLSAIDTSNRAYATQGITEE